MSLRLWLQDFQEEKVVYSLHEKGPSREGPFFAFGNRGRLEIIRAAPALYFGAAFFAFKAALFSAGGRSRGPALFFTAMRGGKQFKQALARGLAVLLLGAVFTGGNQYVAAFGKFASGKALKAGYGFRLQPGKAGKKPQLHCGGHLVHVLPAVPAAAGEFLLERTRRQAWGAWLAAVGHNR